VTSRLCLWRDNNANDISLGTYPYETPRDQEEDGRLVATITSAFRAWISAFTSSPTFTGCYSRTTVVFCIFFLFLTACISEAYIALFFYWFRDMIWRKH
jgi:hypothetical protein